jgi:hypothetical protein
VIKDRMLFESVEQSGRLRNDYFKLTDQDKAFLGQLSEHLVRPTVEGLAVSYLDGAKPPAGDLSGLYADIRPQNEKLTVF